MTNQSDVQTQKIIIQIQIKIQIKIQSKNIRIKNPNQISEKYTDAKYQNQNSESKFRLKCVSNSDQN